MQGAGTAPAAAILQVWLVTCSSQAVGEEVGRAGVELTAGSSEAE